MDMKTVAAERKAKALADLKAAEAMEEDAIQIERLAAKHGLKIEIKPGDPVVVVEPSAGNTSQATMNSVVNAAARAVDAYMAKRKGKAPDPNSVTSRSKSESVKLVKRLQRPVPLGELLMKLDGMGIRLGGKNPNQALSANLGQCPELVSTKRGWWLKGVPLPPEDKSSAISKTEGLPGLN